jgi:signal peptidase I
MAPTIQSGEYISVDMSAYKRSSPQRWDVIVFNPPGEPTKIFAMRVAGLPGDSVSIVSNGVVINGKPMANPKSLSGIKYVSLDYFRRSGIEPPPLQLSSNEFFILGDNSTNAADSRFWGPLHRTNILGRVRFQ